MGSGECVCLRLQDSFLLDKTKHERMNDPAWGKICVNTFILYYALLRLLEVKNISCLCSRDLETNITNLPSTEA